MNFAKSTTMRTNLLLLIPGTLWGFSFLLNEIMLDTIPPFTLTALSNIVTAIPLLIMLYARGLRLKWQRYTFLALFDNAIPGILIGWGQLYIDSGLATILLALSPLFIVLLAHFFSTNDKLNLPKIVGVSLGLLGTLLLVGPSALTNVGANLWGQLAIIGSALCFSISATYIRFQFQKKSGSPLDSAIEALASQLFIATIILLPFALLIDQPWTLQPNQASIIALFASSWGIRVCAMLLYYYLISTVGASTASTTLYLIPINGVFWGALILSEAVTWSMIMALILILAGVMVVNSARTKNSQPATT